MFVVLDGIDPSCPSAAHLGIGPPAIRFQNPTEPEDPGRYLDVDKGNARPQKVRAVDMRRVDQFRDLLSQLFSMSDLLLRILFLQDAIEAGDDVAVNLFSQSAITPHVAGGTGLTYMISPQSTMGAKFRVSRWKERSPFLEIFQLK